MKRRNTRRNILIFFTLQREKQRFIYSRAQNAILKAIMKSQNFEQYWGCLTSLECLNTSLEGKSGLMWKEYGKVSQCSILSASTFPQMRKG